MSMVGGGADGWSRGWLGRQALIWGFKLCFMYGRDWLRWTGHLGIGGGIVHMGVCFWDDVRERGGGAIA